MIYVAGCSNSIKLLFRLKWALVRSVTIFNKKVIDMVDKILVALLVTIICFSCSEPSKEKMLVGKWEFSKTERMVPEDTIFSPESDLEHLNEMNKGLIFIFNEDKTFESKTLNQETTKSRFRISNDGNFIVIEGNDNQDTKWQIIALTKAKLTLNANPTSSEYLVFEKKE